MTDRFTATLSISCSLKQRGYEQRLNAVLCLPVCLPTFFFVFLDFLFFPNFIVALVALVALVSHCISLYLLYLNCISLSLIVSLVSHCISLFLFMLLSCAGLDLEVRP